MDHLDQQRFGNFDIACFGGVAHLTFGVSCISLRTLLGSSSLLTTLSFYEMLGLSQRLGRD